MLSVFGDSVSRKRLFKKVRKNNNILKRLYNTIRERCAFSWLSVEEIGALCNKGEKHFFSGK
jgi:hypothetical protein